MLIFKANFSRNMLLDFMLIKKECKVIEEILKFGLTIRMSFRDIISQK